ncbi:hypothetical protein [Segatella bryantii]|uniref:hypothetical protein n=1 Tax=Segatella bryantii TaxID=77095 RepID=UPI00242CF79A|nr:hypothetical protein [Segatella bryantii]
MRKVLLFAVTTLLTLSSCGDSYKAKSMAKDFMSENMTTDNYRNLRFTNIDSTRYVSDSLIQVLRKTPIDLFKKEIKYDTNAKATSTLLYIRAKYDYTTEKGDTIHYQNTFYFDKTLEHLLAVKQN